LASFAALFVEDIVRPLAKLVVVSGALGIALGGCIIDARAQAYPTKPIRLIVSVQPVRRS
jgi:hypothetical protein